MCSCFFPFLSFMVVSLVFSLLTVRCSGHNFSCGWVTFGSSRVLCFQRAQCICAFDARGPRTKRCMLARREPLGDWCEWHLWLPWRPKGCDLRFRVRREPSLSEAQLTWQQRCKNASEATGRAERSRAAQSAASVLVQTPWAVSSPTGTVQTPRTTLEDCYGQ